MDSRTLSIAMLLLAAAGCRQAQVQNDANAQGPVSNAVAPSPSAPPPAPSPPAPAVAPQPGTPGGLPDDRTPLEEPKGSLDPKSAEAAGQVVQHYGALIEERRFGDAEALWGDASAAKRTTTLLKTYSEAHLQVGKPTDMEGAAGSTYITVPIVLYGTLAGKAAHGKGDAILRRVNDVPGSSEAQRRWHIERIDWEAAA
jgi:hypothetical protein